MLSALSAAVVVVTLATAAESAPSSGPAVVVLPLQPHGSVSYKQADGVTAQLRNAITDDVAKLLSESKDDRKQAGCGALIDCLSNIAEVRGADYVVTGTVAPAPDGLKVNIVVAAPNRKDAVKRLEITLKGDADDVKRIDRVAREAVNMKSLKGSLMVTGTEGAEVVVDGNMVGTLPLTAPVEGLVEGDHVLVVKKPGFAEIKRNVAVVHREITEVKTLLLVDTGDSLSDKPPPKPGEVGDEGGMGTDVIVVGSIGAGLVVLGAATGAFALRDQLDVENRAASQQLAFPTDTELYTRGQVLALTANGLYAAGAIALGAAAVLFVLDDGSAE